MKSCFLGIVLLALPAVAQEGKQHFLLNPGTPEGQMIQSITQEPDDARKLAVPQDFLSKYPKHEGAGWVAGRLQSIYLKQKEYDQALDAGEKALANDPNDLDVNYHSLRAAAGKEDVELVKKWSARTSEVARKIAGKTPAD